MRAWLTPNDSPEGTVDITLTIPTGIEWEAIVRGMLLLLLDSNNFQEFGSFSPEDTAAEYLAGVSSLLENWPSP